MVVVVVVVVVAPLAVEGGSAIAAVIVIGAAVTLEAIGCGGTEGINRPLGTESKVAAVPLAAERSIGCGCCSCGGGGGREGKAGAMPG